MRPTVKITDVAREAGVSPSTVSHVLNGNRPIGEKTKVKVHEAIDKLGYIPNHNARSLKSSRSGIIGFYASDITESFVNFIIRGVEKKLNSEGQTLLFCSGSEFNHDLDEAVRFLMQKGIDGLIVSYETTQKDGMPELKNRYNLPLVFINRDLSPHYPSIVPDDVEAGETAAQNLYEKGVRHPVIIGGPGNRPASFHRISGFKEKWGTLVNESSFNLPVYTGDFTYKSGEAGAEKLLSENNTDGIFCCNDYMAAGAIEAVRKMGLRVPEDVKILGFDNREFSEFWPVPISTFAPPLKEMGLKSAEIILEILKEKKWPEQSVKCSSHLMERASTG